MDLYLTLGGKEDKRWAKKAVSDFHYLRTPPHPQTRSMVYVVWRGAERLGLLMAGIPHATKCRGWWGYDGLPTQWQVLDLNRIWIDPLLQIGGDYCRPGCVPGFTDRKGVWRPTVASWLIKSVLKSVQRDRVSLWPPVFPAQPYHIRLVISYHDPQYHRGTIYRVTGAEPVYTNSDGAAVPGPSGKFCWAWKMPRPAWEWQDINILQPRTMRLPLEL